MEISLAIIIPAYNCEKTIIKTLESIKHLDSRPNEIVIIDDGSNDKTMEVLSVYKGIDFKLIAKKNGGCASARNLGVLNISSDYIFFVDADDEVESWAVSEIKRHLSENESDIIFMGETKIRDGREEVRIGSIPKTDSMDYCILNDYPSQCMIYKREPLINLGFFDETLPATEDLDLYNKFFTNDYAVSSIEKPIYRYNIQVANSMSKSDIGDIHKDVLDSLDIIYARYYDAYATNNYAVTKKIFSLRFNLFRHYKRLGYGRVKSLLLLLSAIKVAPSEFLRLLQSKL